MAQNGYLNAKGQRGIPGLGLAADSYDQGGGQVMWVPYWEDGVFDAAPLGAMWWDWANLPMANGFARPAWAQILGADEPGALPWYATQAAFEAAAGQIAWRRRVDAAQGRDAHGTPVAAPSAVFEGSTGRAGTGAAATDRTRRQLAAGRLTPAEQAAALPALDGIVAVESVLQIARAHDVTVLYGPWAMYGCFFPPDVPYVTFEHATMRYVHLHVQPGDPATALAYQYADWNLITNPDCIEAARCLGLANYSFVPHPLDTAKFCPAAPAGSDPAAGPDLDGAAVAAALRAEGHDLVCYAPARHTTIEVWGSKRNDRIVWAFRALLDVAPTHHLHPLLVFCDWGEPAALDATRALVARLDLDDHVRWLPRVPKTVQAHLYRAADLVLDQFSDTVGSFGAVTLEALACGTPVITYLNPAVHDWVLRSGGYGDLPPVANARTTDEAAAQLVRLATDHLGRAALAACGREWIEREQAPERVAQMHRTVYDRVLARRAHVAHVAHVAQGQGAAA